jgi:hypothetical protein
MSMKTRRPPSFRRRPSVNTQSDPIAHAVLRIEYVPVRDLRPNEKNSHLHPSKQTRKLVRSIKEFGFLIPTLIDDRNTIIAGHARAEAAEECGLTVIPCIRATHLSETQKRAFAILDNRLAEDSTWDFQVLAKEFEFLLAEGLDLQATGFEIPEFNAIFAATDSVAIAPEDGSIPDLAPTRVTTRSNDLWILGEHRLLCGDARRSESFASLMGRSRARLIFVDPPYNVRIRGHVSGKGIVQHREFVEASGEKTSAQFSKFLEDSFALSIRPMGLYISCAVIGVISTKCSLQAVASTAN